MRALVTGGAGFIGSHIAEGLVARGDEVRVLDNLSSGRRENLAGVAAVYGDDPALPKREEMSPAPISPYALEKCAAELYARVLFELHGLETVCLRYFNVFGPRQDPSSPYSGVISVFCDRVLRGGPIRVFGDGEQTRDFVFVEDVVQANLLAATAPGTAGRVYNIGRGEQTTLNQLLRILSGLCGRELIPEHTKPRAGDIRASVAAISRARDELGYAPQTTVERGLAALLEHEQRAQRDIP